MKIGQLFLGLGAIGLVFALCIFGSYQNASWHYQSTWITAGLMILIGLFSIGIGTFVMAGEPLD